MYEIKENSRILKDGTELTTYTRDVVSANILEVEAGTTGYQGGDSGHGGRTYFRIEDAASTDMEVRSYVNKYGCPGFEVVKNYGEYLYDNAGESILAWVIEGAKKVIDLDYQIPVPACVKAAIDEYRSQNDWFGHFMEDKCETGDGFRESSSSLYQAYRNYCIDTNEYVRSTADFYFAMESAGFERVTLNRKRYFKGVRLRTDMDDAGDDFLT